MAERNWSQLRQIIHSKLVAKLDLSRASELDDDALGREVRRLVEHLCDRENLLIPPAERERLVDDVLDELFGLGPLERLLRDDSISEIHVHGPREVLIRRSGRLEESTVQFKDASHLQTMIERVTSKAGETPGTLNPFCHCELIDGSKVTVITPPLAVNGPIISIRRVAAEALGFDELLQQGMFTREAGMLLAAAVKARLNLLVSGGADAGKTSLLRVLATFIHDEHRLLTIEQSPGLALDRMRVITLQADRGPHAAITKVLRHAASLRPDRLIVDECIGEEAFELLTAVSALPGSLASVNALSPDDAMARLGFFVHNQVGSTTPFNHLFTQAVDLILHVTRLWDGRRRLTSICDVALNEAGKIVANEVFGYRQYDVSTAAAEPEDAATIDETQLWESLTSTAYEPPSPHGRFEATGVAPSCLGRIEAAGIRFPAEFFKPRVLLKE